MGCNIYTFYGVPVKGKTYQEIIDLSEKCEGTGLFQILHDGEIDPDFTDNSHYIAISKTVTDYSYDRKIDVHKMFTTPLLEYNELIKFCQRNNIRGSIDWYVIDEYH